MAVHSPCSNLLAQEDKSLHQINTELKQRSQSFQAYMSKISQEPLRHVWLQLQAETI